MLPIRLGLFHIYGILILYCSVSISSARADDFSKPSTSRQSRNEAVRAIPMNALTDTAKTKIQSVLRNTSVYRRLPANQYLCDPDMHNFLIRYPEVVVGIWKVMGITQVDAKRVKDYTIRAADGMGTVSSVELLYGTKNLHVFYGQGTYEGPLFHNQMHGSCVLVLQSEFGKTPDGDPVVRDRLDVFLRVDNIGIKILAKTLHSLVGKTADINFTETTKFIGKISDTAEINGPGVKRLGDEVQSLRPDVRAAFQRLAIQVNDRAAERMQTRLDAGSKSTPSVRASLNRPASQTK